MQEIDISIIVVTYKERLDILKACFDSVQSTKGVSYELIVVDNGASDTTRGLLQSYDHVTYLRNTKNLGFATAVNRGISIAQGSLVLLLNPDVCFEPKVLGAMKQHLDNDADVGIGSCLIMYPNGNLQESIRRFPTLRDQILIMLKIPHLQKSCRAIESYMMRDVDPYKTQDVDSIMGAFMFIKRKLIEQIGYFDEQYFIWFEEVDYCKMAKNAGWKVCHYGDLQIKHHKGHMFDQLATIQKQKWMRQSLRKYIKKHQGFFAWMCLWMLSPIFILCGFGAAIVHKLRKNI